LLTIHFVISHLLWYEKYAVHFYTKTKNIDASLPRDILYAMPMADSCSASGQMREYS